MTISNEKVFNWGGFGPNREESKRNNDYCNFFSFGGGNDRSISLISIMSQYISATVDYAALYSFSFSVKRKRP